MSDPNDLGSKDFQRAEMLFQHGNDAALKQNTDYAIQMYREACKLAPFNLLYRQSLRGMTRRKFGNDPHKVGVMGGARVQPIRMRARAEKAKGHWERVLEICEEAFQINPWDVGVSKDAAEAADHLKQPELACWLMESVFAQGENDVDYLRFAAQIYEHGQQWQKAIACWERVRKLAPNDEHAKRQINALSASATIARAGLAKAVERAEAANAPLEAAKNAALDELKTIAETPEQRLMREIEEEPERIGAYLELADLHRQANRLEDAERILSRGRKANPDDELLRSVYFEVQLLRLKRAIEHWNKKAALDPDNPDIREKLDALREKHDAYELSERKHRVKIEPTNGLARLEYGRCLARQGRHDDAIAEFQQARSLGNPQIKREALEAAGLSFEAKGLPKLAERSYHDALKLAEGDDPSAVLSLHYRLGRVAESLGNLAVAEEHYNEVAAADYTFEDVAERLRALNQRRPVE